MKTALITSFVLLYVSHATVIRSPLQEYKLLVGSIFPAMRTSEGIQAMGGSMTLIRRIGI